MINDALSERTLDGYLSRRWQPGETQWRRAISKGWRAAAADACPYAGAGNLRLWHEGHNARAAWEKVGRNPEAVGA